VGSPKYFFFNQPFRNALRAGLNKFETYENTKIVYASYRFGMLTSCEDNENMNSERCRMGFRKPEIFMSSSVLYCV
jgi:hypothetical protein